LNKNDIRALIPKNKFDNSTIDELMKINEFEMELILPELINWIADFNWLIAKDMIKVLIKYPKILIPVIKKSLDISQEDDILKYWILVKLIPELSKEHQKMLLKDIERIYKEPTWREKIEEVQNEAKVLIDAILMQY